MGGLKDLCFRFRCDRCNDSIRREQPWQESAGTTDGGDHRQESPVQFVIVTAIYRNLPEAHYKGRRVLMDSRAFMKDADTPSSLAQG